MNILCTLLFLYSNCFRLRNKYTMLFCIEDVSITPTKEKHETKLIQKINLSVISSLLNGGVKAPRRALDTLDDIKF